MDIVRGIAVALAIILVASSPIFGQHGNPLPDLDVGIERELKGGARHEYHFSAEANQFLHISTLQKGIEVVITLFGPDDSVLATARNSYGTQPIPLVYVTKSKGGHRVEIGTTRTEKRTGLYVMTVRERRKTAAADDLIVRGIMARTEGDRLMTKGDQASKDDAFAEYEVAAGFFLQSDDRKMKASQLRVIAHIYDDLLYKREKAVEYYKFALAIYEELNSKYDAVSLLNAIGVAYENNLEYGNAVDSYEKALRIAVELDDKPLQAKTLNQLGRGHARQGDFNRSLQDFKSALELNEGVKWNMDISVTFMGLANVYNALGNSEKGLEYPLKNVSSLEQNGVTGQIPAQLLNIGNIYLGLGNYLQAEEYYRKALDGFQRSVAPVGISYALANLGTTFAHRGKYADALDYMERSRQMKTKFQPKDPGSLSNIAWVYRIQEKYEEALEHYQRSLDLFKEIKGLDFAAGVLDAMAQIYYLEGNFAKSLDAAAESVEIAKQLEYPNAWVSLTAAGYARKALGRTHEAKNDLEAAIESIEYLRAQSIKGQTSRGDNFEKITRPYLGMVDLLASEGRLPEAFEYSERFRARYLLEILQTEKVEITKTMSSAQLEQEQKIKNQIAALNVQIGQAKDTNTLNALKSKLHSKRMEYEDFWARMNVLHPGLQAKRGEMKALSLGESGDLLANRQSALVEFAVAEDKVFIFVITKNAQTKVSHKLFSVRIKDKELVKLVESCRAKIANGDLDFQKASRELYDLLLKPATAQLAGKTNIIIVPDGPLWDLPFQALLDEKGKYLVERTAVSYAPSLTALREMSKRAKTRKPSPEAELLAFGNPIVGKSTSERVKRVFMSEKLEPLPESERLVNGLGKMYGAKRSKIYVGDQAREETAKVESPKYRIVQFATHGILNNVSPMYSHLVLAQNEKNPNEDGLLEAWEMKDLDLKADMVILSACETARGRISNGEGVIGMTWASFIAGAPTTVASQWKVESSSTTELMLEFHRQLLAGKGVSKAEALRRASLKLMKLPKYKHPSYWAGFVIVGDAS